MAKILVVDDEAGIREYLAEALELSGHDVQVAADGQAALELLATTSFPLVLTDLKMPRVDGVELVRRLRADQPETEILVLTAHGSVETAVECMKLGVFDYLQKPIGSPTELRLVVDRALERHRLRAMSEMHADHADEQKLSYGAPSMKPIVDALERVAKTDSTVLLGGESGTGKEVAAQAIHRLSPRRDGPFVAINCAALSDALLESELFGHEKGAFTGAVGKRRGRIELAHGGTFFLDEVGELKPSLQAKLLRVLQERQFERVGGVQTVETDVRWIAATNRDLRGMLEEGSFREDLYHRLAVFPIRVPPLRERREDIVPLAKVLLGRVASGLGRRSLRLSEGAAAALEAAPWRGNVRELANTLERAAILADGDEIDETTLFAMPGGEGSVPRKTAAPAAGQSMAQLERDAIMASLRRHDGNRKRVAEELEIGVRTLYDKIKRYAIEL